MKVKLTCRTAEISIYDFETKKDNVELVEMYNISNREFKKALKEMYKGKVVRIAYNAPEKLTFEVDQVRFLKIARVINTNENEED